MGIASLAGWNAIMTSFDFFLTSYPITEYHNVIVFFTIPIMVTNFIAGLACPALSLYFSIDTRIAGCLLSVCGTMISVALIAVFNNNTAGYWISFSILFV